MSFLFGMATAVSGAEFEAKFVALFVIGGRLSLAFWNYRGCYMVFDYSLCYTTLMSLALFAFDWSSPIAVPGFEESNLIPTDFRIFCVSTAVV